MAHRKPPDDDALVLLHADGEATLPTRPEVLNLQRVADPGFHRVATPRQPPGNLLHKDLRAADKRRVADIDVQDPHRARPSPLT